MTMTMTEQALMTPSTQARHPEKSSIMQIARQYNVSPFRQLAQILDLQRKRNGICRTEYYSMGLFHPRLTAARRREFVGKKGSAFLNSTMQKKDDIGITKLISDKLLLETLLTGLGLPTTRTQAILCPALRPCAKPNIRTLEQLRQFLHNDAVFPIFSKPMIGRCASGYSLLLSFDDNRDTLRLADHKTVALDDYFAEVMRDNPQGVLLQHAEKQHSDLSNITGTTLGRVRIVTISGTEGPTTLYTVWKLPAAEGFSDKSQDESGMIAEIDHATGEVLQVRRGLAAGNAMIRTHPESQRSLTDINLPFAGTISSIARQAHGLFPSLGIIGWDIGICDDGPVILGADVNPDHTLYQRATGEGILNERFTPEFEAVKSKVDALTA